MNLLTLTLLSALPLASTQSCPTILSPPYTPPVLGSGWTAQLISTSLSRPRTLLFDATGALLVLEQRSGIIRLVFSDESSASGTCLVEQDRETVVEDGSLLHGMALSRDGRVLFASSSESVFSWPYDGETGKVDEGGKRELVRGMDSGGHVTRTLFLVEDGDSASLLVSRGSDGNIDPQTRDIDSGVSQIRSFALPDMAVLAGDGEVEAVTYDQGGVIGWGLRNSVGVTQNPSDGGIWSVENSSDQMKRLGVDIHVDNPGEELNFHGYLSPNETSAQGVEGGNFGYPDCFALWSQEGFSEVGELGVGDQFAPEGSEKTDAECADEGVVVAPRLTFQAHTAPLDLMFSPGGGRLFVTFHGSWNRDDPVGYSLAVIPFDTETGQPVAESGEERSFSLVMSNGNLNRCPGACFRPVGLAMDGVGRVWMSSDSTGEIYVLKEVEVSATGGGGGGGTFVGGDDGGDSESMAAGPSAWEGVLGVVPWLLAGVVGTGVLFVVPL